MHDPVLTKEDFVQRYQAGEFGNRAPTWDSIHHWKADIIWRDANLPQNQQYHIRSRIPGGKTFYDCASDVLASMAVSYKIYYGDYYISAMAPHSNSKHLRTIQGEVCYSPGTYPEEPWGRNRTSPINRLQLTYTHCKKPMRDAMAEWYLTDHGRIAWEVLYHNLDAASLTWLKYLLREYPYHVIEFSCFDKCWGTVPGYNTVVWEVRNY